MPILIDGDNLLGTWPGRDRSDEERRRLARSLLRRFGPKGPRAVIVFDGPPPGIPLPTHDVRYAGRGRSADDIILAFLRGEKNPREWTVVTSDRSLGDRCRHLGARVERCDRFRPKLRTPVGEEKPDGDVDVGEWMEYFGLD